MMKIISCLQKKNKQGTIYARRKHERPVKNVITLPDILMHHLLRNKIHKDNPGVEIHSPLRPINVPWCALDYPSAYRRVNRERI